MRFHYEHEDPRAAGPALCSPYVTNISTNMKQKAFGYIAEGVTHRASRATKASCPTVVVVHSRHGVQVCNSTTAVAAGEKLCPPRQAMAPLFSPHVL